MARKKSSFNIPEPKLPTSLRITPSSFTKRRKRDQDDAGSNTGGPLLVSDPTAPSGALASESRASPSPVPARELTGSSPSWCAVHIVSRTHPLYRAAVDRSLTFDSVLAECQSGSSRDPVGIQSGTNFRIFGTFGPVGKPCTTPPLRTPPVLSQTWATQIIYLYIIHYIYILYIIYILYFYILYYILYIIFIFYILYFILYIILFICYILYFILYIIYLYIIYNIIFYMFYFIIYYSLYCMLYFLYIIFIYCILYVVYLLI